MGIFQGKSIAEWQHEWDLASGTPYDKALSLLAKYSGGFKTPIGPGYWFYSVGRFFKGHWNTHHGEVVSKVVNIHRTLALTVYDVSYYGSATSRTVANLLGDLKAKLGGVKLKSEGDLNRIITVIQNNTNISYTNISTNEHGVSALQNRKNIPISDPLSPSESEILRKGGSIRPWFQ